MDIEIAPYFYVKGKMFLLLYHIQCALIWYPRLILLLMAMMIWRNLGNIRRVPIWYGERNVQVVVRRKRSWIQWGSIKTALVNSSSMISSSSSSSPRSMKTGVSKSSSESRSCLVTFNFSWCFLSLFILSLNLQFYIIYVFYETSPFIFTFSLIISTTLSWECGSVCQVDIFFWFFDRIKMTEVVYLGRSQAINNFSILWTSFEMRRF